MVGITQKNIDFPCNDGLAHDFTKPVWSDADHRFMFYMIRTRIEKHGATLMIMDLFIVMIGKITSFAIWDVLLFAFLHFYFIVFVTTHSLTADRMFQCSTVAQSLSICFLRSIALCFWCWIDSGALLHFVKKKRHYVL